jgi:hypothetical protein
LIHKGDLANPGPANWNGVAWTDTTRLHIWADTQDLHLFVPMAYTTTVSVGQLGLAIDTGLPGGGSGDAWGNAITYAYTATQQNLGSTPITGAPHPTRLPDSGQHFWPQRQWLDGISYLERL